jgi:hypothetical protein
MAASFKITALWATVSCIFFEVGRRFIGAHCLHHQGDEHHSSPWWWWQYAPLKRLSTSTLLHGATSQKTLNFILAAVRTWNLTCTSKFVCRHQQVQQFIRCKTESSLLPLTSYWFQPVKTAVVLIIVHHNIKWLGAVGGVCIVLYWLHYRRRTLRKITTGTRIWEGGAYRNGKGGSHPDTEVSTL